MLAADNGQLSPLKSDAEMQIYSVYVASYSSLLGSAVAVGKLILASAVQLLQNPLEQMKPRRSEPRRSIFKYIIPLS